jgi:hypothetical protein
MVKRAREFSSSNWRSLLLLVVFAIVIGAAALSARQGATVQRMPNWVSNPVTPELTIALMDAPRAAEPVPGIEEENEDHRTYPRPGQETVPTEPPPPQTDALLAQQEAAVKGADRAVQVPVNVAGQAYTFVAPADPSGAVGPSHFVQAINDGSGTRVTIYNKNGTFNAGPFILDSLGLGECATGGGDPVVLYDRLANRWLLSEFADFPSPHLCVYVSTSGDPLGTYWRYDFTAPVFPDYPKYAVWPNAYYATSNEDSPAIYAFDRTQMLAGGVATFQRFEAPSLAAFPFQALTPADLDGNTAPPGGSPGIFMRHRDDEAHNISPNGAVDFLEIWTLAPNFVTPLSSIFSGPTNIAVTSFDSELCGFSSFSCFPQPSGLNPLDPLREVIMYRLQYRNFGTHEALIGNFTVDTNGANRGGIRWFELRRTGGGGWTVYQQGTYSPDAVNRWMGGIAMDGSGNILLTYSVSSASVFPGLRFTGRAAADALGTMTTAETTIMAGTGSNSSVRWGDYHMLTVDPSDDCTFWFTGGYSPTTQWATRIASLKFDGCGGPAITAGGGVVAYGNYVPANAVVDVGERVSVNLTLANGGAATSNLVATLAATGGVTAPSAAQSYGAIATSSSAARQFRFTATGSCGATLTATLSLQDGATSLGTVPFLFTLGCSAGPQTFTDSPLTVTSTPVRATHVNELRSRINLQRSRFALGAFGFTNPTLTPGTTVIQGVHVLEMRTALAAAYTAAGLSPPSYTNPSLAGIVVQAVHINELRAAVASLENF